MNIELPSEIKNMLASSEVRTIARSDAFSVRNAFA